MLGYGGPLGGRPLGGILLAALGPSLSPAAATLTATTAAPSVALNLSVPAASLTLAADAPTAGISFGLSPAAAAIARTSAVPIIGVGTGVSPGAGTLTLSAAAPTEAFTLPQASAAIGITTAAPSANISSGLTPVSATLSLAVAAPSLTYAFVATPAAAALTLSTLAPQLTFNFALQPTARALTLATAAPSSSITAGSTPNTATLTLAAAAASLGLGEIPPVRSLSLAVAAPQIAVGIGQQPGARALVLTAVAPTLGLTANISASPSAAALSLSATAPSTTAVLPPPPPAPSPGDHNLVVPMLNLALVPSLPIIIRDPNKRLYIGAETAAFAPGTSTTITLANPLDNSPRPCFQDDGILSGQIVSFVVYDNDVGEHGQYEYDYGTYTVNPVTGVKQLTRNLVRSSTGALLNLTENCVVYLTDEAIPASLFDAQMGTATNRSVTPLNLTQFLLGAAPKLIENLTMSWISTTAVSIDIGAAADSTASVLMRNAAALQKTTSAWAVGTGNGGIDTGTFAANATYHWYLIQRSDTGIVDAIFSLNAATPALPAKYDKYRRIGSLLTATGAAQWRKFFHVDDNQFLLDNPVTDANAITIGTTASLVTVSVPNGIQVRALVDMAATPGNYVLITSPDQTDTAAGVNNFTFFGNSTDYGMASGNYRTNTLRQIRARASGSSTLYLTTHGWIDSRKQ
jgi:hypothetical protein